MIRSPLQPLYDATAFLASLAMAAIAAIILIDVCLRQFGGQIQSSDDFSVYALAATALLGLGPTYRRNEHIRVGLVVDRIGGSARRMIEIVVLVVAVAGVAWATLWSGAFAYDSFRYHEMSQGLIAIPLWIPQLSMPLGFGVFLIALVEDLWRAVSGGTPSGLATAIESDGPTFER
jgi:TRAP-type C4-dicarboxylate transport system permease small subunit